MGTDPSTSVCDTFGRTHDHENLFVIGAPTLPTGGFTNGTLTFVAVSLRSANRIAEVGVMPCRRLGVLISGRGSNLKAIIDAIERRRLDASIAVVISNRADAPGLEHARQAGIETLVISHQRIHVARRLRSRARRES